jgi:hypothetical protein
VKLIDKIQLFNIEGGFSDEIFQVNAKLKLEESKNVFTNQFRSHLIAHHSSIAEKQYSSTACSHFSFSNPFSLQ